MIPPEEPISLDAVALCISEGPVDLGISATVQVKSVLVQHDGRWINHYTVLHAGVANAETLLEEFTADRIRLVKRTFSSGAFTDGRALLKFLTSWQESDITGAFQQSANVYHHASSNRWSEYPCWSMDVYDNQPNIRDFTGPRGPFKKLEKKFLVEDLPAAVARWAGDPTSQENTIRNAYRIILPDQRAYFTKKAFDGHRLRVTVAGRKKDGVSCTLSTGRGEEPEWRQVRDGNVEFVVMGSPRNLEAYLIDEHEGWCDKYWNPLEPTYPVATAFGGGFSIPVVDSHEMPGDESITESLQALHAPTVYTDWQRALERRDSDPAGAITLARTLLETTCKHILDERSISYAPADSLSDLHKKVSKALGLAPSQQTEQLFKQILSGVTSVVGGLEGLRNQIGDAHGRTNEAAKPVERHARLAVNLAGAVAAFLAEAHVGHASSS